VSRDDVPRNARDAVRLDHLRLQIDHDAHRLNREPDTATNRLWAAAMLTDQLPVLESILHGQPVLARQLEPAPLRRALRGGQLPAGDDYLTITPAMLDAIVEGGAFE
jgi:hypothetical protein